MPIPTEPVGSVPRSPELQAAMVAFAAGEIDHSAMEAQFDTAVADTLARYEAAGSTIVCDGEQTKSSFATYPLEGMENLAPDGVTIPFADGHTRQLPRLTSGPFRYRNRAGTYVERAKRFTELPVKQAVIAPSVMALLYPDDGLDGYDRDRFISDLVGEAEADIRSCFDAGADSVQIDFTEGRLALKLDPSGGLLQQFVDLNNAVLDCFSDDERSRIGIHTCPGGDHNSTHSADVDYRELIPTLLTMNAGRFFMQMASEDDPAPSLAVVAEHLRPDQRVYVGVIDTCTNEVETPAMVRDRVLLAADHIPLAQLGTTDDCGFSPFGDDVVMTRDVAFAKIAARVEGTALASAELG